MMLGVLWGVGGWEKSNGKSWENNENENVMIFYEIKETGINKKDNLDGIR